MTNTPGPWLYRFIDGFGFYIDPVNNGCGTVARVYMMGDRANESAANARLIAQAPSMLRLLGEAEKIIADGRLLLSPRELVILTNIRLMLSGLED